MPARPSKDAADRRRLTLVSAITLEELVGAACPYSALLPSTLPPGVWSVGPSTEFPGYQRFDLVSDDGRLLQPVLLPTALAAGKQGYIQWWRLKLNGELLAHRCPDCPVRPPNVRRRPVQKMA